MGRIKIKDMKTAALVSVEEYLRTCQAAA